MRKENKVKDTQLKLSKFRVKNVTIDPIKEIKTQLSFVNSLQLKKAELIIDQSGKDALYNPRAMNLAAIKKSIRNIDELIRKAKDGLLKYQSGEVDLLRDFEIPEIVIKNKDGVEKTINSLKQF